MRGLDLEIKFERENPRMDTIRIMPYCIEYGAECRHYAFYSVMLSIHRYSWTVILL